MLKGLRDIYASFFRIKRDRPYLICYSGAQLSLFLTPIGVLHMKNCALLLIFLAVLTKVAVFPVSSHAQSYSTIDGELGLYCADLPNGTNALVRLDYKGGLTTINTLDPADEKAGIVKLRK